MKKWAFTGNSSSLLTLDKSIHLKDKNLVALPGFFDVHIHGGYGYHAFLMDKEKLIYFLKKCLYEGTSQLLLTTLTESTEKIDIYLNWISKIIDDAPWEREAMAKILGIHLEGPFISIEKKGAQNQEFIIKPSIRLIKKWQKISNNNIRLITYAPERASLGFQKALNELGIVGSCGHSVCSGSQLRKFANSGLSHITHTFNAMSPFHHQEIGVVGESFLNEKLNCEIISDRIHVVDEAMKLLYKNKGCKRIQVITDSVSPKGLPDGEYKLGGLKVIKKKNSIRLTAGNLAGSISYLNKNVFNLKKLLNLNWNEVALISSVNQFKEIFRLTKSFDEIYLNSTRDYFIFNESLLPLYYVNKLGVKKLYEMDN